MTEGPITCAGLDALVYINRHLDEHHNPFPATLGLHPSTHFISKDILNDNEHSRLKEAFLPIYSK
jgi:hypothetical protein